MSEHPRTTGKPKENTGQSEGESVPQEAERLLAKIQYGCGGTGFIEVPASSPGPGEGECCPGCDGCDPTIRLLRALLAECVTLRAERDDLKTRERYFQDGHFVTHARAEQAEAERDRLKAEQQTCLDHGPHLGCHWCPECYQRAWTAGKADAESASQSLVERVRGLEEALKQARDFYWGRARYDHAEDHAIDFDGPKEDCPDCQRQCAVIAKWDALLSSVSEQKEEQ